MRISLILLAFGLPATGLAQTSGFDQGTKHSPAELPSPQDLLAADMDQDGDLDLIVHNSKDRTFYWFESLSPGVFSPKREIGYCYVVTSVLGLQDVDGDGLLDLMVLTDYGKTLSWFKRNPDGQFSALSPIMTGLYSGLGGTVADIDMDGDFDIVCRGDLPGQNLNEVVWLENLGGGAFARNTIQVTTDDDSTRPLLVLDGDLDGDLDVLWVDFQLGSWIFSENLGGGNFAPGVNAAPQVGAPYEVLGIDWDHDGDRDLVVVDQDGDELVWHQNLGSGNFASGVVLSTTAGGFWELAALDTDGDGAQEIIVAVREAYVWRIEQYSHIGAGLASTPTILTSAYGYPQLVPFDLGGDNLPDLAVAQSSSGIVQVYPSTGGALGAPVFAAGPRPGPFISTLADLDGDGNLDMVVASAGNSDKISWYPNQGNAVFGAKLAIATMPAIINCMTTEDLDLDGDLDIIATGGKDLMWIENLGSGLFAPPVFLNGVGGSNSYPLAVVAADISGNGFPDIVSANHSVGSLEDLTYTPNLGGGVFGPMIAFSNVSGSSFDCAVGDADLDGDQDLFLSAKKGYYWAENLGAGNFGSLQAITTTVNWAESIDLADMDGDGFEDLLLGYDKKIAWMKILGAGQFGPLQQIADTNRVIQAQAIDLNLDGKLDLVAASLYNNTVSWHENIGAGQYGPGKTIVTFYEDSSRFAAEIGDLNGDGWPDLVTIDVNYDLFTFLNQMNTDCNGNSIVDSDDILSGFSQDCNANGIPDECDLLYPLNDVNADGVLDDCVAPALTADVYEISLASGGQQTFTLNGQAPGMFYFLAGTITGPSPGMNLAGFNVPLNSDAYFVHTMTPNTPPLSDSFSTFDAVGSGAQAYAALTVPPGLGAAVAGLTLHHAFVTIDPLLGVFVSASNAVPLVLIP